MAHLLMVLRGGVLPYDRFKIVLNCNCEISSNSDDVIVGLQTDKPLKRIINPYGGVRMVHTSLEAYNHKLSSSLVSYKLKPNHPISGTKILFFFELSKNIRKKLIFDTKNQRKVYII